MASRETCPCGSNQTYDACCGVYHRGEREAPDAETLMRSRFAAYARGNAEYLWKTLHPEHDDRARPRETVIREFREAFVRFRYQSLRVLDRSPPDNEGVARVLFIARIFERGRERSFIERSDFLHDGAGWRYLCGATLPVNILPKPADTYTLASFPAP
jgi:SEC-C motif-containing protein